MKGTDIVEFGVGNISITLSKRGKRGSKYEFKEGEPKKGGLGGSGLAALLEEGERSKEEDLTEASCSACAGNRATREKKKEEVESRSGSAS